MKPISSTPTFVHDTFLSAEEQEMLLPHADMFLRLITSGGNGIRVREDKLLVPLHIQRDTLKLVGSNFIAKPWKEVIAFYVDMACEYGCDLNEAMDERELLMTVADFYLTIKFPRVHQIEQQSESPITTQQNMIVREEVSETLDTSPYTNPDYLMRAFFPCMGLAVQPVDQTLEITKKILDFPKRLNVGLMKDFLRYFAKRQNKPFEKTRSQEELTIKTIEYLLLHLKLHLGRPLIIASSLLHGTEAYASTLRSLHQAGIIGIKPSIFAELSEMIPPIPEKSSGVRTSKLSSEHHRRVFDESLLQEMGYRNAKSLHPQMMIALGLDDPMTVMDIANALHALSDAQYYQLKKSQPIIFHTYQKLFEHVLLEMNPHHTRKRFLIKSTR